MPPVGPQGSRGGLITAVVVFTILFVSATVVAIYSFVALDKEQQTNKTLSDKIKKIYQVYPDNTPDAERFNYLLAHLSPGQTVLTASIDDSRKLADLIAGSAASTTQPALAVEDAHQVIESVNNRLDGLNLSPDSSLIDVINKLASTARTYRTEFVSEKNQLNEVADADRQQIAGAVVAKQQAQADVASAVALKQQYLDQIQQVQIAYQDKEKNASLAMDQERQDFNAQLKQLQGQVAASDRKFDDANKQIEALNAKLSLSRINVIDPLIRKTDGEIVSVASDSIVYINLGSGDHILPGMTFQVYDAREGVPKQDDMMSPDNLPAGKASIEIERIDSNSSQCRVLKLGIGQHINEGDLIKNLVYDRNTKFDFVVYGDFDLSNTGTLKPGDAQRDAEKIKTLIVDWGGRVQKTIDVNTDFVVMGTEPVLPNYSADDLENPFNAQNLADKKDALQKYEDVLNTALQRDIPVMNQNRFLYFCGYYENAQR